MLYASPRTSSVGRLEEARASRAHVADVDRAAATTSRRSGAGSRPSCAPTRRGCSGRRPGGDAARRRKPSRCAWPRCRSRRRRAPEGLLGVDLRLRVRGQRAQRRALVEQRVALRRAVHAARGREHESADARLLCSTRQCDGGVAVDRVRPARVQVPDGSLESAARCTTASKPSRSAGRRHGRPARAPA